MILPTSAEKRTLREAWQALQALAGAAVDSGGSCRIQELVTQALKAARPEAPPAWRSLAWAQFVVLRAVVEALDSPPSLRGACVRPLWGLLAAALGTALVEHHDRKADDALRVRCSHWGAKMRRGIEAYEATQERHRALLRGPA